LDDWLRAEQEVKRQLGL